MGGLTLARGLIRGRFPNEAELDRLLKETTRGVAEDSELIFAAHARYKTGRMSRGVKATVLANGDAIVSVTAVNPQTGYDYVGVTRFGHRKAFIEPRADRRSASVIATGNRRGTVRRGNAALRFVLGGRVVYRRRVKGFKPAFDWAEAAMPEVGVVAQRAMETLGKKIVVARI